MNQRTIPTCSLYWVRGCFERSLQSDEFSATQHVFTWPATYKKRLATTHMALNLSAVVLYIVSLFLRMNNAAFQTSRWTGAMTLEIVALVTLRTSRWLGGQMAYVHRVGVLESEDETQRAARRAA